MVFVGALICSRYWFRVMWIHGDSMYPTYHDCQLVLLDVRKRDYSYGDVIAFDCPALQAVLVKRIVGRPGDTVQILDGKLYINDINVELPHLESPLIDYAGIASKRIVLDWGTYFVLGDNISKSKDSRHEMIGCINDMYIIGRIVL